MLEDYLQPSDAVADVGTGSGILAEAAFRLGASEVIACDTDPESVEVAQANWQRAGLKIPVFLGSAADLQAGKFTLILANISPEVLLQIAPDLLRAMAPYGRAILSGIEEPDLEYLLPGLAKVGFAVVETREESNWRGLVITRELRT
jgi:ribosomal protein L11 methyltransferase